MHEPAGLREAVFLLNADADRLRDEDLWRLKHPFFGPLHLPQAPEGVMLLIGARSGLEGLLALRSNPATSVYIVEQNPWLRERVQAATGGKALLFPTLDAAWDAIPERVDFVRVDAGSFRSADLRRLLQSRRIRHLCGEATEVEIEALELFRLCRAHTESFYLHLAESGHDIGGLGGQPDIEVSVVIPAYNVAPWLDQTLQSMASQSLARLEVLVVDDGSTDETGTIADAWATRDPRFRVIRQANGGCAAARNAGLAAARGEYVGLLDGDDWVDPRMFEELYRAAVLRGAEIAQCGFYEAFPDGARVLHPTAWGGDGPDGRTGLVRDPSSMLRVQPSVWRRIYRVDYLRRVGIVFPSHIRRFDDLPFAFLSIAHARTMAILPDCYYAYRQQRPGQDVEARDERLFVHFDIFDWLDQQTRSWASQPIRDALRDVQRATHRYALGRIEKKFRLTYLRRALAQMRAQGHGGTLANLRALLPTVIRAGL